MKLRIRDIHNILKLLKDDERFHQEYTNDSNAWLHREIEVEQHEENVEEGKLTSTLKIKMNYSVQKRTYNNKINTIAVETNIEVYDVDEKRAPVCKRTTTKEPEE